MHMQFANKCTCSTKRQHVHVSHHAFYNFCSMFFRHISLEGKTKECDFPIKNRDGEMVATNQDR